MAVVADVVGNPEFMGEYKWVGRLIEPVDRLCAGVKQKEPIFRDGR